MYFAACTSGFVAPAAAPPSPAAPASSRPRSRPPAPARCAPHSRRMVRRSARPAPRAARSASAPSRASRVLLAVVVAHEHLVAVLLVDHLAHRRAAPNEAPPAQRASAAAGAAARRRPRRRRCARRCMRAAWRWPPGGRYSRSPTYVHRARVVRAARWYRPPCAPEGATPTTGFAPSARATSRPSPPSVRDACWRCTFLNAGMSAITPRTARGALGLLRVRLGRLGQKKSCRGASSPQTCRRPRRFAVRSAAPRLLLRALRHRSSRRRRALTRRIQRPEPIAHIYPADDPKLEQVLSKLRVSLRKRTATAAGGDGGVRGLARHFRIVDRNGNGALDPSEFFKVCA